MFHSGAEALALGLACNKSLKSLGVGGGDVWVEGMCGGGGDVSGGDVWVWVEGMCGWRGCVGGEDVWVEGMCGWRGCGWRGCVGGGDVGLSILPYN